MGLILALSDRSIWAEPLRWTESVILELLWVMGAVYQAAAGALNKNHDHYLKYSAVYFKRA